MLEGDADHNTPSANLRYLLRGLAGLHANLFSVYVWERESYQTFRTNLMIFFSSSWLEGGAERDLSSQQIR